MTADKVLFAAIPQLQDTAPSETFLAWEAAIQRYARFLNCHRTLGAFFAEPGSRSSRPPGQVAGDAPPDDADWALWSSWSAMEARSRALVLCTVSRKWQQSLQGLWSASEMVEYIREQCGEREKVIPEKHLPQPKDLPRRTVSFLDLEIKKALDAIETLTLAESATAAEMASHVGQFNGLVGRLVALDALPSNQKVIDYFTESLSDVAVNDLDRHRTKAKVWKTLADVQADFVSVVRRKRVQEDMDVRISTRPSWVREHAS